jgi:hypothetical protein
MTPAAGRRSRAANPLWLRVALGLGFVLAVAATVVMVISDDSRVLRLSVLAAVWAALLAAFALTRARRDVRAAENRQEESKRTYEIELLREVSARREYEFKVAETARAEADAAHREELAALREQLDRLTQALAGLLDGDLLVQRLTLSAESTRIRQIGDTRGRPPLRQGAIEGPFTVSGVRPQAPLQTSGQTAPAAMSGQGPVAAAPSMPGASSMPGGPLPAQPGAPRPGAAPAGPPPGFGGRPRPPREDDTVQIPLIGARGPAAGPVPVRVEKSDQQPTVETVEAVEAVDVVEAPVAPVETVVEEPARAVAQPEPEPVMEPEPVVEPEPIAAPEPEPVAEIEPVVEPVAEPEPEPEPVAEVETAPEAMVEPEPEPVAVVQPEPSVEPEPVAEVEPVVEPAPVVEPDALAEGEPAAEPASVDAASVDAADSASAKNGKSGKSGGKPGKSGSGKAGKSAGDKGSGESPAVAETAPEVVAADEAPAVGTDAAGTPPEVGTPDVTAAVAEPAETAAPAAEAAPAGEPDDEQAAEEPEPQSWTAFATGRRSRRRAQESDQFPGQDATGGSSEPSAPAEQPEQAEPSDLSGDAEAAEATLAEATPTEDTPTDGTPIPDTEHPLPRRHRRAAEDDDEAAGPEAGRHTPPADDEGEPAADHAAGVSVSDLLAAYGTATAPSRHRRRADD